MNDAARVLETKFRINGYWHPITLILEDERIFFKFNFNKSLISEIKSMEGYRWHGNDEQHPVKLWSIPITPRNRFQLRYLMGQNPYTRYDSPLVKDIGTSRPLKDHQLESKGFVVTRGSCILAEDMGLGKTLVAIEMMEDSGNLDPIHSWYVGPKSGVIAVDRELVKWGSSAHPRMLTYDGLVKIMESWEPGAIAPRLVIFDESSKIKNPTAKRSQASLHLANAIRDEHGDKGYIILMSGTPSPKDPTDWWHQTEVCCPGFLKEGSVAQLRKRLAIIENRESIAGGVYPHLLGWLDDENKCLCCGEPLESPNHLDRVTGRYLDEFRVYKGKLENDEYWQRILSKRDEFAKEGSLGVHSFLPSRNEVALLHERLKGLVYFKLKKDCLNLPEKIYEIIRVTPSPDILRTAKLIEKTSLRAIEALTRLRELSDGFQYSQELVGTETCSHCQGKGVSQEMTLKDGIDPSVPGYIFNEGDYELKDDSMCPLCEGERVIKKYKRVTMETASCPKDDIFINELDAHEEVGRLVVWGAFEGTIDRLIKIAHQYGWATLRFDKKVEGTDAAGGPLDRGLLLDAMDRSNKRYSELLGTLPKLCFIGNPDAGGMALTLTATPTELFYSNSFNGGARMQSEDRCHRIGMDENRNLIIKDIIHLPTDQLVLNNLKLKKHLQSMTMGELREFMEREM